MAIRTISAAGGNWNSTATWVGGVIPTTSDSVLGDATSGQLTLNVNATVQFLDFTNYTQTLTFNSGIILQLSLAASTNTFGASMNFGGTGTLQLNAVASTWVQNTTNRIPNVIMSGSVTRTLSTDMYVGNLTINNAPALNGNTIYISGNFLCSNFTTTDYGGTTNYFCDGSGIISAQFRSKLTITGTYNTANINCYMFSGGYLEYKTGGTPTLFNVILNKRNTSNDVFTLDVNQPTNFNLFLYERVINSVGASMTITLSGATYVDLLGVYTTFNIGSTENTMPTYTFIGNSFSANTVNIGPAFRNTSSTTNPPAAGSLNYESAKLRFDQNFTHYFGKLQLMGGTTTNATFRSITGGVQVPIVLGSKITSQICNYNFTDVDASGGQEIVAINGTLTNTSNITNVYPTGGGGGQTAYTFFS